MFGLALAVHLTVLYWPVSPSPSTVPDLPGLDKVVHLLVFALVAGTGLRAGLRPVWLLSGLAAHGVLSEVLQHAVLPRRGGDPADVVADLAGVLVGGLLARTWVARASWGRDRSCTGGERPDPGRPAAGGDAGTG